MGRIYFQLWILTSSQTTGFMLPHGGRARPEEAWGWGLVPPFPLAPLT